MGRESMLKDLEASCKPMQVKSQPHANGGSIKTIQNRVSWAMAFLMTTSDQLYLSALRLPPKAPFLPSELTQ
jgi:hypothetical protein